MSIWESDLLNEFTEECAILDRITSPDGYGGYKTTWTEGAHFHAIILKNNETADLSSGAVNNTTYYGVKTAREVPLEFRTVFRRLSDGKVFRITADEGMMTPSFSLMNTKQMPAEEWVIPNE